MSYYDDYDDEYSSEDDIFYHNYSVDYANQLLSGQHAVSSRLPLRRRKHRRHSPRLVRVATLDEMPTVERSEFFPSLHSRPKYSNEGISSTPLAPPPLPTLEATGEELERRATRRTQSTLQDETPRVSPSTINHNNNLSPNKTSRALTETELRQVQEQQEAFQQHLLNMERHLLEQSQQPQHREERQDQLATHFDRKNDSLYHDLELENDQTKIAELIENDPYIAAAMEDFAYTHGLLDDQKHSRRYFDNSTSSHLCRRHRKRNGEDHSYRSSSSSSSLSSSTSSLTTITSERKGSNIEMILLHELHGIRRLMKEYVRNRKDTAYPYIPIPGIHYPPVPPVTDYQPSKVPPQHVPPPEPSRVMYQNVVNAVRDVIDRRSPSQREQPLKPSEIDPQLKHVYKRRPRIVPSTPIQQPSLPPSGAQQSQRRRRSSQLTTPPIVRTPPSLAPLPPSAPPLPPSTNIPPAPPYEALAKFTSLRSTTNQNRKLSYGNHQKQSDFYDTLRPGHYLHLYANK